MEPSDLNPLADRLRDALGDLGPMPLTPDASARLIRETAKAHPDLPPGLIVERSVLPANWAAFPWSAITLKEVSEMAKGLSAEKRAELERVLGPDLTEQIVAGLEEQFPHPAL